MNDLRTHTGVLATLNIRSSQTSKPQATAAENEEEAEKGGGGEEGAGEFRCFGPLNMGSRFLPRAAKELHKKSKLLVLDVNGLLLERVRGKVPIGVNSPSDATFRGVKVFQRPHMKKFVEWCIEV